jgi:hypothetical protein
MLLEVYCYELAGNIRGKTHQSASCTFGAKKKLKTSTFIKIMSVLRGKKREMLEKACTRKASTVDSSQIYDNL